MSTPITKEKLFEEVCKFIEDTEKTKRQVSIKFLLSPGGMINDVVKQYDIRGITDKLREKYPDYHIKSTVSKGQFRGSITWDNAPCSLFYEIIWEVTVTKKTNN